MNNKALRPVRRVAARAVDTFDNLTAGLSTGSGREFNERALRRGARMQTRDEIVMGEHKPSTWLERGWADHANRQGWTQ